MQAEDKAEEEGKEEDRVEAEEEDKEWEERQAAVDRLHAQQATVCVPTAASKFLIKSDTPAAKRAARNAEQK